MQHDRLQLPLWQGPTNAVDQRLTDVPSAVHREDDVGGSGSDSDAASDEEAEDMEVAEEEDYADLTGTRTPQTCAHLLSCPALGPSCCRSAWPGHLSMVPQFR